MSVQVHVMADGFRRELGALVAWADPARVKALPTPVRECVLVLLWRAYVLERLSTPSSEEVLERDYGAFCRWRPRKRKRTTTSKS